MYYYTFRSPRGRYVVYMGLTKATWLWIHRKAGILIMILAVVHYVLHRQWIIRTTKSFFRKGNKDNICIEKKWRLKKSDQKNMKEREEKEKKEKNE